MKIIVWILVLIACIAQSFVIVSVFGGQAFTLFLIFPLVAWATWKTGIAIETKIEHKWGLRLMKCVRGLSSLILPLIVTGIIFSQIMSDWFETGKKEFNPVVEQIKQFQQSKGRYPKDLSELTVQKGNYKINAASYYQGKDSFVLTVDIRSIDIDGNTLYYASKLGDWEHFHNDMLDVEWENPLPEVTKFKDATKDLKLIRCRRTLKDWQCQKY